MSLYKVLVVLMFSPSVFASYLSIQDLIGTTISYDNKSIEILPNVKKINSLVARSADLKVTSFYTNKKDGQKYKLEYWSNAKLVDYNSRAKKVQKLLLPEIQFGCAVLCTITNLKTGESASIKEDGEEETRKVLQLFIELEIVKSVQDAEGNEIGFEFIAGNEDYTQFELEMPSREKLYEAIRTGKSVSSTSSSYGNPFSGDTVGFSIKKTK